MILIGVGSVFWWKNKSTNSVALDNSKLQVVATFYPLGYFAQQVGGDKVVVTTIVPNGVEPHDFAPTPRDIININQADVFIYTGAGFDPWAENVDTKQRLQATTIDQQTDPHVWLDPVLMQAFVTRLSQVYSTADPSHKTYYTNQANDVIKRLYNLDQSYQQKLYNCSVRKVITTHNAFAYLANRYGFEIFPVIGLNPNEAPSAQTIAELSDLARSYQIKYIFFEEMTSPKVSETLAQEVGAQAHVLSPLESATSGDYFSIMESNANVLATAMECQ
ncbi:MAG: zinc ABC transporter substrate-binding protein [Patescibacteria group bacterium]